MFQSLNRLQFSSFTYEEQDNKTTAVFTIDESKDEWGKASASISTGQSSSKTVPELASFIQQLNDADPSARMGYFKGNPLPKKLMAAIHKLPGIGAYKTQLLKVIMRGQYIPEPSNKQFAFELTSE